MPRGRPALPARDLDEPLYSSFSRLLGQPLGRHHMYGLELMRAALNVEADCIHDASRAFNGGRDGLPLANVRGNRLDLRIIAPRGSRMPGGDPDRKPLVS